MLSMKKNLSFCLKIYMETKSSMVSFFLIIYLEQESVRFGVNPKFWRSFRDKELSRELDATWKSRTKAKNQKLITSIARVLATFLEF